MSRVQLITTGLMEERALGESLRRVFPEHEFVSGPHLDGFTSATLPPPPLPTRVPTNLDKLAGALVGSVAPGNRRDRPRPDFIVAVDDVELVNADDPSRITGSLREAVERRLTQWPTASDRSRQRLQHNLRQQVSFHLMAPMTEAYFFADSASLARATAPKPARPNRFSSRADVEAFAVDDPDYLDPPADPSSRWRTKTSRRGHPKRYLIFLTDERYRESEHGADALAKLHWPQVTRKSGHCRFARSLLADLADMLGSPSLALDDEQAHPLTWPPPREPILRNM